MTPLSPDRYKVQVTIGGDTLEKLRLAKDLLRHAVPSGDEAVILDRALTALLADLAQSKFGATEKPRPSGGSVPGSRHIPAEVRRTVWLRDLGRCAFVGTGGRRCHERAFLEFHHVTPHALGGEATVANIELRCRSHNAYEARLYFGNGNGTNGGAGSVREKPGRYGLPAREQSLGGGGANSFQERVRGLEPCGGLRPEAAALRGGSGLWQCAPGAVRRCLAAERAAAAAGLRPGSGGSQRQSLPPEAARISARHRSRTTSQRYSAST